MAHSTKRFTLTSSAYQDISEGNSACAFRLPFRPQPGGGVLIHLGTSLPSAGTSDFDLFIPPLPGSTQYQPSSANFTALSSTDRVYARAADANDTVSLTVYRR